MLENLLANKIVLLKGLAGIGFVAVASTLTGRLMGNATPPSSFECITTAGKRLLAKDQEIEHHMLSLQRYRDVSEEMFDTVLVSVVELMHLHSQTAETNVHVPFKVVRDAYQAHNTFKYGLAELHAAVNRTFADNPQTCAEFKEVHDMLTTIFEVYPQNIRLNVRAHK